MPHPNSAPILAELPLDLTTELAFCRHRLVLTAQHLRLESSDSPPTVLAEWPLDAADELQFTDHAGVGTLTLVDAARRKAHWRFTMKHRAQAEILIERFKKRSTTNPAPPPAPAAPIEHWLEDSPDTASTLTLLRLWRFARPYRNR